MPLIALNVGIENIREIRGMSGKWARVRKTSMESVAKWWLKERFPSHFTPGNESRYQHKPRNRFYKTVVKKLEGTGQGRFVDLTLKGTSERWLRSTATVTATSNRATVRMQGPTYFANPKIGRVEKTIQDNGHSRVIVMNISQQPDKVAELTRVNENERGMLRRFLESDLQLRVNLALRGAG